MRAVPFSLLLLLTPLTPVLADQDWGKLPYQLVREALVSQDKALLESKSARAEQRRRIIKLAERLMKLDTQVWQDPKNARAAVIYVLSGGDPQLLRRLIAAEKLGIDAGLVNAVLAYGEKRDEEAIERFEAIDMSSLDPGLVGHVALVHGLLIADKSPDKALALLDLARISSAGTIVEEAALRQEAILAAKAGDLDKFEALASQYFRRFSNSIYAESFQRQLAGQIVSDGYAGDVTRQAKLEAMFGGLPQLERRDLCLTIAEEGIAAANVEMVRFAAKVAAIDAKQSPQEAMRLKLFEAAATVVTAEAGEALATLGSIDRSMLSSREEALLDAALAVVREVRRPPPPVSQAPAAVPGDPAPTPAMKLVKQANDAIARADKLLSEAVR